MNLNIPGHVPLSTENDKFPSYHPKTEGSIYLTAFVDHIPCKAINILVIPFNRVFARSNSKCNVSVAPFLCKVPHSRREHSIAKYKSQHYHLFIPCKVDRGSTQPFSCLAVAKVTDLNTHLTDFYWKVSYRC